MDFYKDPPEDGFLHSISIPVTLGIATCASRASTGLIAPDAENSVQWLAELIVADDRFAEGDGEVLVAGDYGGRRSRHLRRTRTTATSKRCC